MMAMQVLLCQQRCQCHAEALVRRARGIRGQRHRRGQAETSSSTKKSKKCDSPEEKKAKKCKSESPTQQPTMSPTTQQEPDDESGAGDTPTQPTTATETSATTGADAGDTEPTVESETETDGEENEGEEGEEGEGEDGDGEGEGEDGEDSLIGNDGAPTSSPTSSPTPATMSNTTPFPTENSVPSQNTAPTPFPTSTPTTEPTASPTSQPTLSPSQSPSGMPTRYPTAAPTAAPTYGPTEKPSSSPSEEPSSNPTRQPTAFPTGTPTNAPTNMPSAAPSRSPNPTGPAFETVTLDEGTEVSTCVVRPIDEGSTDDYTFDYHFYIPNTVADADVDSIVSETESNMHDELSRAALTCDREDGEPFFFASMSSGDVDVIDAAGCSPSAISSERSSGEFACYLVHASIRPEVMYNAQLRRLNTDAQVVSRLIELLQGIFPSLSEQKAPVEFEFIGFTNIDLDGTENGDNSAIDRDPGADLLVGGSNLGSNNEKKSPLAPLVIAGAGICLVALIVALVTRRKRRADNYLQHLEKLEDDYDDSSLDLSFDEQIRYKDFIINDESMNKSGLDEIDQALMAHQIVFKEHHDDRNCVSETCEICQQKRTRPLFIATEDLRKVRSDIRADLGAERYISARCTPATIDDTQIL